MLISPLVDRTRKRNKQNIGDGPIVYWMNRELRMQDNAALLYAQEIALAHKRPLIVVYNLVPAYLGGGSRQFDFKVASFQELHESFSQKEIPWHVVVGEVKELIAFFKKEQVGAVVTDMCPLKVSQKWVTAIAKELSVALYEVDAHNIVPVWTASPKQEFAARTIRPKLQKLLPQFLVPLPALRKHPHAASQSVVKMKDIEGLRKSVQSMPVSSYKSGEKAAHAALRDFIKHRLVGYAEARNNPPVDGQSNLSPYLHYGMIAPLTVALAVRESDAPRVNKDAFLEELIIRRELADNFCFYNDHYDSEKGFPNWAKATLEQHAKDRRDYLYSYAEFEKAQTHDALWNAAQQQMVQTGKMHGYMRMYWAKKILEWTPSVHEAMRIAIKLNDTYELDGRDPNGYVGIAWSIGGVHDRAWFPRPIFGTVRYMSANGCASKFNVDAYIAKWNGTQKLFA